MEMLHDSHSQSKTRNECSSDIQPMKSEMMINKHPIKMNHKILHPIKRLCDTESAVVVQLDQLHIATL